MRLHVADLSLTLSSRICLIILEFGLGCYLTQSNNVIYRLIRK